MAAPRLYTPSRPNIASPEALPRYLFEELGRISLALDSLRHNQTMDTLHVAPSRPFEGMYVKADGTDWDPGNGPGPYMFNNGAWLPMFDTSGTAPNTFGTVAVSGQSDVVADAASDTLTLVAGANITITTTPLSDSVTISSTATSEQVDALLLMGG